MGDGYYIIMTSCIPLQLSREDSQLSFERLLSSGEVAELASGRSDHHTSPCPLPTSLPLASPPLGEKLSVTEQKLRKQLVAAGRKLQHLTEVLRESEASALRLSDQAKLLKEEIRR